MIRHIDKQSPKEPRGHETKDAPAQESDKGKTVGKMPVSEAERLLSEPVMIPRNPIALAARNLLVVFFLDFGVIIVVLSLAAYPALSSPILFLLTAMLILIKSITLIYMLFISGKDWSMISYYLTERQLIIRQGLVNLDEEVYELDNIRHVRLHQGFLGRVLDFGAVELMIATAGLNEKVRLNDLKNPEHFRHVFSNYIG